jgi:hypothetical protein
LVGLVPHYRLSQTMDACLPTSTREYREFWQNVLHPGAVLAGLPI